MKITFKSKGDFSKGQKYLQKLLRYDHVKHVQRLADLGLQALINATPKDSGITADSWDYVVETNRKKTTITWTNDSKNGSFPIAIMLQYGHGTGTGGYVYGQDYINPAIQPIFDQISEEVWKEVVNL